MEHPVVPFSSDGDAMKRREAAPLSPPIDKTEAVVLSMELVAVLEVVTTLATDRFSLFFFFWFSSSPPPSLLAHSTEEGRGVGRRGTLERGSVSCPKAYILFGGSVGGVAPSREAMCILHMERQAGGWDTAVVVDVPVRA